MRKLIYLYLAILMLLPVALQASIYGSISGKVVDEDGKGVIGATVRVLNTSKGTIIKSKDGSYTIINLTAGDYELKITFIGKDSVLRKLTVSADQDTKADFVLRDKGGITTQEIVVEQKRELIKRDIVGSTNTIDKESIVNTATTSLTGVIGLQAGVFSTGSNFYIRGSRPSDTQIRVDGLDVGNQFSGGFGASGAAYFPMVSNYAIQEAQVITGGFSAEYGEAMGGIVNSKMKEGNPDHYDGFATYRTDLPALFGSQSGGVGIVNDGNHLKAVGEGDGHKLQGTGLHNVEAGVGGPIPLLAGSSFYFTGSYKFLQNRNNSYDVYDSFGNNLGFMPDERTWIRKLAMRMKLVLTGEIYLSVGGDFGLSSFESSSWGWLYSNDQGLVFNQLPDGTFQQQFNTDGTPMLNGIPERIQKQNVTDQYTYSAFIRINHTLSESSFYELTISNTSNNDETARRVGWNDPSFFGGFEKYTPVDNYKREGDNLVPGQDRIIDYYQFLSQLGTSSDGYFSFEKPSVDPLTGYYEGQQNTTGTNNPWGLTRFTATHGGGGYSFRAGNYWQIDGNYENHIKAGEFLHKVRTGFAVDFYEMHRSYNGSPYDANPFYDVYTDGKWGGNLLATTPLALERSNHPKSPTKFYVYLQDQISYKGITLTPGLRFDYFDPNSNYRLPSLTWTPIDGADSLFGKASSKYQVSPRLQITYPITDRSVLSLSYGMFFKMPELQNMYDNYNLGNNPRGSLIIGQPNMDAQRTNQYEVSYRHAITDAVVFQSTIYYKDIYNQLGTYYIPTVPDPYWQYTVSEYGNSRGIEFVFQKLPQDHFGLDLNYTLSSVEGTSTSAASNAGIAFDPYTNRPAFPLAAYPLGFDIRHQAKGNLNIFWLQDDGPSIGGMKILENTNLIFTGTFRSGTPYTRTDVNGRPLSETNGERNPSVFTVDFRLQRSFNLKEIFGDGAGNTQIQLYLQVYNLLDATSPFAYYSATGDPIDDGKSLETKPGDFPSTAYYKDASIDNPSTYSSAQYDSYGNRLYSKYADYDNNGIVTQAETYQSYIRYLDTSLSFKGNFQEPRSVYFGMLFTF